MEYKEEANIRSIGNLRAAEAEALQTSAATIQKWANRGASVYEKLVTDNAIMEANKVDVTAQAPELKSSWTKVGQVYNDIVLEGHKSAAINQFRSQIDKAEIDSNLDVEGFQKSLSTMKGKALELADPSIRAYLANEFDSYAVPRVGKKQIEKDSAELGVAVSNIQQKVQADINTAMEAVANGDEEVLAKAEESIYSAADQIGQYDPEMADNFIKNYQTKRLTAGYVGGFREAYAQGRGDAYIAEIATKAQNITTVDKNGNKTTVGLTDDVVESITERLKAENTILNAKKDEDRVNLLNQTSRQVIAIELQADRVQEDYDAWESSVDSAYNAGLFGDLSTAKGAMQARNKYRSLIDKQMTAIEKKAKDAGEELKEQRETDQSNANITSILNGTIVVDENNVPVKPSQEDVDVYFGQSVEQIDQQQQIELAKNLFTKTGKFPSLTTNILSNKLVNKNPAEAAETAKIITDLSKGLNGYDVVKGDQLAYASQIVANIEAGEPPQKAIDYARKSTVKDDAAIDYRGKQYSSDKTADDNRDWIKGNMDGALIDEAIITQRFETLVRNRVVNDGATLDFARDNALQKINSEYAEFNGNVMYQAPSAVAAYTSIDGTGDWVQKDFMKGLYDLGQIDTPTDAAGARNFILVPIPGEDNEFFPISGAPVYQIMKLTDEGPVSLVADYGYREDGTPKGEGWLGLIDLPSGKVMSEVSAGFEINGRDVLIPLIVPGLNEKELDVLAQVAEGEMSVGKLPKDIKDKAIAHAREQMQKGESPFKDSNGAAIYKPSLTSEIRQSQFLSAEAKERIDEKIIQTLTDVIAKDNAGSKVGPLGITNKAGIEQEAESEARRMLNAGEVSEEMIKQTLTKQEYELYALESDNPLLGTQ